MSSPVRASQKGGKRPPQSYDDMVKRGKPRVEKIPQTLRYCVFCKGYFINDDFKTRAYDSQEQKGMLCSRPLVLFYPEWAKQTSQRCSNMASASGCGNTSVMRFGETWEPVLVSRRNPDHHEI